MTAILGGALLLVPAGSVVTSPIVPLPLRVLLAGLWLTALLRPHVALVALTLLAPFGSALIAAFDAAPIQYVEALVLATLSGVLIAVAREDRPAPAPSPSLAQPAAIFSGVVFCSLAVVLAVSQVGIGMRWLFFSNVGTFIARDYLVGAPGQWIGIAAAAQLLEGVLLLLLIVRLSAGQVTRPLRIFQATAVAAAAAALLSLGQLTRLLVILAVSLPDLITRVLISRVSVHVADLNAAGSYYAMAAFVALALVFHDRQRRGTGRVWMAMTTFIVMAMWLTGSRTAAVASAGVFACTALSGPGRAAWRQRPVWLIVVVSVLAFVAGAMILGFDPRAAVVGRGLGRTFESRSAFIITGVRMIASAPIFGVGIGRYYEMSGQFMPQSIYWFFFHENAHNNFLQIGGELGLAGLAAFLWLLVAIVLRVSKGLHAFAEDRLLTGALAGLAAFVTTWLIGHPLLSPEVAVPFWIVAAAAVARADGDRLTVAQDFSRAAFPARLVTAAALLALAVSIPLRARAASAALKLSEQTFGFYGWEGDPGGRMRWTSPSAAFFVPPHTTEIEIPMRASFSERRARPTIVSIAIDGHVFHRIDVTNGDVFTVHVRLPTPSVPATQPRRVDIITNPPWSPADVLGTPDNRVLGVRVGDVTAR